MSDLHPQPDSALTGAPSFADHVRPLFREIDRLDMLFQFDLWEYDDVCEYAEQILLRVEDQTMPCDDPWSENKIELFRAWVEGGCAA